MFERQLFSSKEEMLRQPHAGNLYETTFSEAKTKYRAVKRVLDGDALFLKTGEPSQLTGADLSA